MAASPPPAAAPPAEQHDDEAPGAEFFRRRLQRAMAIPPEQRDPAVHAFVTSVQLMQAAEELLPLTAAGQPALPADTVAGQQAEVQAMLMAATAVYIAAEGLVWEGRQHGRLNSYVQRRLAGGTDWQAAYLPALQPLGGRLLRYFYSYGEGGVLHARTAREAADEQASPGAQRVRAALSRQLQRAQQATSLPLLDAVQLEAFGQLLLVTRGNETLGSWQQAADENEQSGFARLNLTACALMTIPSCEMLVALQPSNPKALLHAAGAVGLAAKLAAAGVLVASQFNSSRLIQRAMELLLSALRAARAQRSAFWVASASGAALLHALMPGIEISGADLAAVIAAAEETPATQKQMRSMLPHSWMARLQTRAELVARLLPGARALLQAGGTPGGLEAAVRGLAAARVHLAAQEQPGCICAGCGRSALGLRRCSLCKKAAYCSRECQVRHWSQHKSDCKDGGSRGGGS